LQPNGIEGHLQRKHLSIPLEVHKELVSYAESLILRNPSEVIAPVTVVSTFDCLKVTKGFHCSICNALYGTPHSIQEHCRAHKWMEPEGTSRHAKFPDILDKPQAKSQMIQTFFEGTDIKYFAVTVNNSPLNRSDKTVK